MGYTAGFYDDTEYCADDINNIIKTLTCKGICLEFEEQEFLEDNKRYKSSQLNELMKIIATKGVIKQTCQVEKKDLNQVRVTQGTIIFTNGSTITIESTGEVLPPYESGVKQYVYAKFNMPLSKNSLVCSPNKPSDDDVPLAEISTEGTIIDKRQYARGKLLGLQTTIDVPRIGVDVTLDKNYIFRHPGTSAWTLNPPVEKYKLANQISVVKDGYLYQVFGGPGNSNGDGDTYVRKVDSAGNTIYVTEQINGYAKSIPRTFYVSDAGKCYIAFGDTKLSTSDYMSVAVIGSDGKIEVGQINLDWKAGPYTNSFYRPTAISVDGLGNIYVYYRMNYSTSDEFSILIYNSTGTLLYANKNNIFESTPEQFAFVGHPTEGYVYALVWNTLTIWTPTGLYTTKTLLKGEYMADTVHVKATLKWKNDYLYIGPYMYDKLGNYMGMDSTVFENKFPDEYGNYVIGDRVIDNSVVKNCVYSADKKQIMSDVPNYGCYFDESLNGTGIIVNGSTYITSGYETYIKLNYI